MAAKDSSDISSDSDSSFELEIESDGVIRPFIFEPQHGTSSEAEVTRTWLKIRQKRWNIPPTRLHDHVLAIAIGGPALLLSETESICSQEMNVLGDRLDLDLQSR